MRKLFYENKTIIKSSFSPQNVIIFCLLALTALTGCAANVGKILQPTDILTMNIQNEKQTFYLRAGDEIGIKFFHNSKLNDEVTIMPDGKISLQLIGDITAAGLTPEQLTSNLKSKYAEILLSSNETYILRSGDKINIEFFYDSKLNNDVIIRPDGKISLQLIGDITAAGLTPDQLTSNLKVKYAKVLRSSNRNYILGSGDKIGIRFFHNSKLNDEVIIKPDGKISLQLIGDVIAAGLTPEQLTSKLKSKYDEVLKASNETYILDFGDKVAIKFFYNSKLNDEVFVRPDGKISLQLIGDVFAAGLTPDQLSSKLDKKYSNILELSNATVIVTEFREIELTVIVREFTNQELAVIVKEFTSPELTVIVEKYANQKIYVGGEVKKPGPIIMKGMLRTLEAVIAAGGALDTARFDNIFLIRYNASKYNASKKADVYSVNLNKIVIGELPDIILRPYDIVYLPKKTISKINLIVDQYFYNFLPKNAHLGFNYNLTPEVTVETK